MKEGHRDQHACGETGKVRRVVVPPGSKAANDEETYGRDPGREEAGQDGKFEVGAWHVWQGYLGTVKEKIPANTRQA